MGKNGEISESRYKNLRFMTIKGFRRYETIAKKLRALRSPLFFPGMQTEGGDFQGNGAPLSLPFN